MVRYVLAHHFYFISFYAFFVKVNVAVSAVKASTVNLYAKFAPPVVPAVCTKLPEALVTSESKFTLEPSPDVLLFATS